MPKAKQIFKVELIDIKSLKKHPDNYRTHGPDQLVHIKKSLKTNNYYKNIVIAKDNTILAGHGVVEGASELKWKQVPVVRLNIASNSPTALKILAGDNEIPKLGFTDDRKLSEILRDIAKEGDGLVGSGFDETQLANLVYVTRPEDEIKDFNAAREWVGLPAYDIEDPTRANEPVLVITFENKKDRDKFVEKHGIKIRDKRGDRKWSTIWPFKERNDLKSVKFEDKEA